MLKHLLDWRTIASTVAAAVLIAIASGTYGAIVWVANIEERSQARDEAIVQALAATKLRVMALELTGEPLPPHLIDEAEGADPE